MKLESFLADGLPLAVQCIARRFRDEELLSAGAVIAEIPGPLPPPSAV
jgi:Asp-tRNA(Asn)/Glu-tRNA(Gln) amidotransferase A subunit family amidase